MTNIQRAKETEATGEGFLKSIAIDAVIFGFHDNQLKVLLIEYKRTGLFGLPGGFVRVDEDLNTAALRVASERTGLTDIYLEQFYVFGDYSRYDPSRFKTIMTANGQSPTEDHWLLKRFVSVGYYALVDFTKVNLAPAAIFDSCNWYDLNEVPTLIQDHNGIIKKALEALRLSLDNKLTGFNLLPRDFTMGNLQTLYETILGRKLLRPAFQRKMLALGILERVAKKWTGGAHKAPYLYRFVAGKTINSEI
ncbi:NUDIX hydrolase [Mucilaginibacter flavidus]|uniref:NUDIX hydrolase n=1 Tax=Mucilaginibacter flavidus TaxID=2949309 RepID=UPI002093322F|nr:NUDIX domain-containing protein [Mucilaginibacter flavidus]MCO5947894.1 NUDIX domain-containing protein [Mucilaginibacter flavidus]